jgi:hypothetical protein
LVGKIKIKQKMRKNVVVFDFFAGTFSVTKSCTLWNAKNNSFQIQKVIGLEKSHDLCKDFLNSHDFKDIYQNKKIQKTKIYCTDILLKSAKNKILAKFEKDLTDSFLDQNTAIDGVLVFGGPPCTFYSSYQNLISNDDRRKDPNIFLNKQKKADNRVISFLEFYENLKVICEKHTNPYSKQKIINHIIMENPWSSNYVKIGYEDDFTHEKGDQVCVPLALRKRDFMQKYLFENNGYLLLTRHNWCAYDYTNFPKKPTVIFSTMKLKNRLCTHIGKHPVQTNLLKTATLQAKWPESFVDYCFCSFSNYL